MKFSENGWRRKGDALTPPTAAEYAASGSRVTSYYTATPKEVQA